MFCPVHLKHLFPLCVCLWQGEAKAALESRGYRLVGPFPAEAVRTEGWLIDLVDTWSRLAVRPPTKRARTERSDAARFCESSASALLVVCPRVFSCVGCLIRPLLICVVGCPLCGSAVSPAKESVTLT